MATTPCGRTLTRHSASTSLPTRSQIPSRQTNRATRWRPRYVELGLPVPEPVRPPNALIFDTVAHRLDYPPRWDVTDNA